MMLSLTRRAFWPLLFAAFSTTSLHAADGIPSNLGGGLDKLVAWHLAHAPQAPGPQRRALLDAEQPATKSAQIDAAASSATADVRLDGTQSVAQVSATLEALGCTVLGTHDIGRAGSIISVKLPLDSALAAARTPGVLSIVLVQKPRRRAGKVTSQGVALMKANNLRAAGASADLTGSGITVGVVSDSFDVTVPHAAVDVQSGDLPGGNNAVVVVQEGDANPDEGNIDEGRAMLQIIHDVAPGARLSFAACGSTQTTFAAAIRSLRTSAQAPADVITDDILFPDEPYFSDGPVALAVEDVVTSTTLAGRKVAYYSAAGNDAAIGLNDTFRLVSDADVRARRPKNNLKLGSVPVELTAGGFHNFGTAEAPVITQKIKVSEDYAELDFQWDDPFVPVGNQTDWVSTDYNLLVFSTAGAFLFELSGTDNNFATGQPFEYAILPLGSKGQPRTFQVAITRRGGGAQLANRLHYSISGSGRFESTPIQRLVPTLSGHTGARGSDGVAAYHYDMPKVPADFTSAGPLTICFDRTGHRLTTPEVRQQPTMAAPDNVDTTFFPPDAFSDTDGSGFPNFSGTSAAAPHAAGVAALLLQAKGGPGSLTAAQLRTALQGSVASHDLDPAHSQAVVTAAGATAKLEARGDDADQAASDTRYFKLTFTAPANTRLTELVIDLSTTPAATPLVFDPSSSLGLPFRVGAYTAIGKKDFSGALSPNPRKVLTVKLKNKKFVSGATLEFGVDRDLVQMDPNGKSFHAGGNSADLLEGATVKITTLNVDTGVSTSASATFTNSKGKGYSPIDGFGLIDAQAALSLLP